MTKPLYGKRARLRYQEGQMDKGTGLSYRPARRSPSAGAKEMNSRLLG